MSDKEAADQIMVYCFVSPDERAYEQAEAAYRKWWRSDRETHLGHRDNYPASGWTMAELIGSQWINLHTCHLATVTGVGTDRWNRQYLPLHDDASMGLGLWWNDRFVVGHWVRFDGLNPDEQFTWYAARVAIANRQVATAERDYERHKHDPSNAGPKRYWLRHVQRDRQWAVRSLRQFAAANGFYVGLDVLNAGITGTEDKPAQLRMFE